MRRLISSLWATSLLAAAIGCSHTAGVCDCDATTYGCGGCCGNCGTSPTAYGCCAPGAGNHLAPVPNGIAPKIVEPIKEMPKENGKDKEEKKEPAL